MGGRAETKQGGLQGGHRLRRADAPCFLALAKTLFTLVDHALRRDVAKTWQDLSLNEDVADMQCYTLNLGSHVNHLF